MVNTQRDAKRIQLFNWRRVAPLARQPGLNLVRTPVIEQWRRAVDFHLAVEVHPEQPLVMAALDDVDVVSRDPAAQRECVTRPVDWQAARGSDGCSHRGSCAALARQGHQRWWRSYPCDRNFYNLIGPPDKRNAQQRQLLRELDESLKKGDGKQTLKLAAFFCKTAT